MIQQKFRKQNGKAYGYKSGHGADNCPQQAILVAAGMACCGHGRRGHFVAIGFAVLFQFSAGSFYHIVKGWLNLNDHKPMTV